MQSCRHALVKPFTRENSSDLLDKIEEDVPAMQTLNDSTLQIGKADSQVLSKEALRQRFRLKFIGGGQVC